MQKNKTLKKKLFSNLKILTSYVNIFTIFLVLLLSFVLCFSFQQGIEKSLNKCYDYNKLNLNGLNVYFFNVGQGDCSFIEFPDGKTMIVDSGTQQSSAKTIDFIVNKILKDKPLIIDYLVLTHSDIDHCGGMLNIVNAFQVNNIIRPRIYDTYNNSLDDLHRDNISLTDYYSEDNAYYHSLIESFYNEPNCNVYFLSVSEFNNELKIKSNNPSKYYDVTFYSPQSYYYGNNDEGLNNMSAVFTINYNNCKILFTGDMSSKVENEILNNIPQIDVLKVAHHGSKYSCSEQFISTIKPKCSIISVGKNSYGHPSNNVLNNLNNVNSKIYRTDKDGTIVLNVEENKINTYNLGINSYYIQVLHLYLGIVLIILIIQFFIVANNLK